METRTYSNNLEDDSTGIRASAIIEMGRTGNRDAVRSIIEVLENREEVDWLRCCAAIALGRLPTDESISSLIDTLRDDSIIVSRAVISALGDAANKQAIPHLKEILENKDKEELHAVTVTVLGEIGGYEIVTTLLQALESPNDLVRVRAALALGELRAEEAVIPLMEMVKDSNECLRALAASSLGLIGDNRAVELLIEALNDSSETVRIITASSLGYLGDSSAMPPLEEALNDKSQTVRKQATVALLKLRSKEELTKVGGNNSET